MLDGLRRRARQLLTTKEERRQDGVHTKAAADAWGAMFAKGQEHLLVRGKVTDPYSQSSTVYKAVRAIANRGSSVAFSIFRGDERVDDHPLYTLMAKPNDHTHGTAWLDKVLVYLEICGESFWLNDHEARDAPGGARFPRRFRFLDPRGMTVVVDKQAQEVTGWTYQHKGSISHFDVDQVVHIQYVNPWDPYRGLAPLSAARLSMTIGWKARKWQDRFLTNGGMPSFYATWPKDVNPTPDQRERTELQFRNSYLGLERVGKPAFMFQGGELKSISPTQKDMDWLGGIMAMDVDVLGCFNVPPPIVGILDQANYSNMREAKRYMLYATVFPKLDLIGSVLQAVLVDVFWPGDEWRWDKDAKIAEEIPEDVQDKVETVSKLWGMGVPFKEAAATVALDIDTTDKPWLEAGWLPLNLRNVSDPEPEPEVAPPPPPEPPSDPDDGDPDGPVMESVNKLRQQVRILEHEREPLARGYVVPLRAWYHGLRAEVLANLAAAETVEEEPDLQASSYAMEITPRAALPPDADPDRYLFAYDEAARNLVRISRPAWVGSMESGGVNLLAEVGSDDSFDVDTAPLQGLLADKAMKITVDGYIVATINNQVRRVISVGIDKRQSVQQVATNVREVFNGARKNALDIARTEMGSTFNMGRFDGMRQAGIQRHQWVTADAAARESHDLNQQQGPQLVGTRFSNGLLYPGDPTTGDAGEVVNCRCNTVAVV